MSEAEKPQATPQLESDRFKLAESEINYYAITIEPGITRAQILNPAFLAHVAAKLRPYTEITVRCDDGTLYAKLLVLQAERTWARCHVLEWHDLTTKDMSLTQAQAAEVEAAGDTSKAYTVEYKGPHKKFCVIRQADKAIVREGEITKKDATLWLDEYLKVTT